MKRFILKNQLKKSGASEKELEKLSEIADKLSSINVPSLSDEARERIESRLPVDVEKQPLYRSSLVLSLAATCAVFMVITVAAQSAPVTSPIYNIKRGTDFIRNLWSSPSEDTETPDVNQVDKMQPEDAMPHSEIPTLPEEKSDNAKEDKTDKSNKNNKRDNHKNRDRNNWQRERRSNSRDRNDWRRSSGFRF